MLYIILLAIVIFLIFYLKRTVPKNYVKVKKWIDTPDLKRNEKYILEWHDFVIELQEQLMKMTDESYSKKINLFVLQSFFVEPYDMQTDFYIQFENRLAKTKTVIRQLQKGQK